MASERLPMNVMKRHQLGFVGHIMTGEGLENVCLTGRMEGAWRR